MEGRFVSYLRVSTKRQGDSGLGLDAQRSALEQYLNGGGWTVIAEFVEVESGKRSDNRPELQRALAACRIHNATLVVARLDRLSRNAAFLMTLRDSGVDFVAADQPFANKMTIGILAVVAEAERERISANVKSALQAAKRRGKKLGTPRNLDVGGARLRGTQSSAAVRAESAKRRAMDLAAILESLRAGGIVSLNGMARALTDRGIPTARRGSVWTPTAVARVVRRLPGG